MPTPNSKNIGCATIEAMMEMSLDTLLAMSDIEIANYIAPAVAAVPPVANHSRPATVGRRIENDFTPKGVNGFAKIKGAKHTPASSIASQLQSQELKPLARARDEGMKLLQSMGIEMPATPTLNKQIAEDLMKGKPEIAINPITNKPAPRRIQL